MNVFKKSILSSMLAVFSFVSISAMYNEVYPLHYIIKNFNNFAELAKSNNVQKTDFDKSNKFKIEDKWSTLQHLIQYTLRELNDAFDPDLKDYLLVEDSNNLTPLELAKKLKLEYIKGVWAELSLLEKAKFAGGLIAYSDDVTKGWDRIINYVESMAKLKRLTEEDYRRLEEENYKKLGLTRDQVIEQERSMVPKNLRSNIK